VGAFTGLAGYWGSDSSVYVNFTGTDDHLRELYIHPGAGWVAMTLRHSRGPEPERGPRIAAGEGWGSESIPEPTPSALTPVAVQLRTVGVKRAIPRRIHRVRLAITDDNDCWRETGGGWFRRDRRRGPRCRLL
jgi:hypothetical protein